MPQATTLGGPNRAIAFEYAGSVRYGVTIKYNYGNVPIDQKFFQRILTAFRGRRAPGWFSENNPTPNGFGEWIRDNSDQNSHTLTPRYASRIAAIPVAEQYATSDMEGNAVFIKFSA
jgi:hypothetical protein